ncbi:unnamed protein product [marine sediment metagenome]|uniref:STAS/SEC14 domain-containing protein n=1 Tax=marine sediment metagenome TaxID=412755 RepID=X1EUB4_9ZZZZ
MYRIEKIGENQFYIKALGTFPPVVAKRFIKDFNKNTKKSKLLSVIVDGMDFILLNIESFKIILDFLRGNNERLDRSAWIISKNPPLDKEIQILLERAKSPKRKIVENLDEAKEWIGVKEIIIESD